MKIEKFSHHFVVSDFTEMEKRYIGQFINRFSEIAYDRFGTQVIVKRYASTTKSFKEFRLHINSFSEFIEHLKDRGLNIDKITIMEYPLYEAEEVKYDPITFVPRDYQEPIIDFILNSKAKAKLVELQAGKGKSFRVDEPVLTINGWVNHGHLKVGDLIANTYGGFSVVEGIFPQGKLKLYKVTFADGRDAIVSLDHLWQVRSIFNVNWVIKTTGELIDEINTIGPVYFIPCAEAWEGLDIKIDYDAIQPNLPISNKTWLDAKVYDRYKLLNHYLEIIGHSFNIHRNTGCASTKEIAEDIQYLIRSLGGYCKITEDNGKYYLLFEVESADLRIKSIDKVGEGEAVCIKTSAPNSLYITRDFVVTHNTGTSLYAMYQCKKRFAVATKGGFVGRWISDICGEESVLKLKYDRVIEVKGSVGLKRVIELALQDELDFDAILISTNTLSNYYQHYFENDGNMEEYGGLHPVALWALLKIEHLITDEFHLLLHMNYIREMFNHIPSTIALSATIIPDTPLLTKVYATLFPPESIAPAPVYDKYINVKAYFYGTHPDTKQIKCMRNGKYSHTMYEESILKHKKVTKRYLDMIALLTNGIYVGDDKHLPSEKMVIYVSTKAMATEVTNYLNKLYGEKYVIKRFISEDPYSNVLESHIIVSTPLSLGTAHDIADLRFILLTTAIGKEDTNEQLKSRLRRLKNNPTVNPTMYYLVNRDVNKHIVYHRKKRENFKSTTLSQEEFDTPFRV